MSEISRHPPLDQIKEAAASWVPRLATGLTADEELEFESWIEADPRHSEILAQQRAVWERFGALAEVEAGAKPDPDRFAPATVVRPRFSRYAAPALAAAAAVAVGFFVWSAREKPQPAPLVLPAPLVQRTLPDGSTVELNRGADIAVNYTAAERRVTLLRGEANFQVAKHQPAPFIVSAGGAEFRAVGTAFNVRYDAKAVELVVTEGKVQVATPADLAAGPAVFSLPVIEAGHGTVVSLEPVPVAPAVAALTKEEVDAKLAWQPKLLDFDDAPLSAIVADFNERNPVHLVITDPTIASLRLNASFRSDNMEGFVRLLESNFSVRAEALSPSEIGLRRSR